jgi:hypothetical protein
LIILEENILDGQRLLLEASRIATRQIGVDVGHKRLDKEAGEFDRLVRAIQLVMRTA